MIVAKNLITKGFSSYEFKEGYKKRSRLKKPL
jgi:hypothetical protein